jgi:hypothetical protein
MKFSGHDLAKSNSSVQEMGLYFSNPGKYAERNVGKVQSAAEIKIENILMANPYVDGCYVYKNEDSNLVLNNPALERWGEEVSYDFVEEVSSNCPKAQRNQRSASRIVDLLQEFGTDRSVDITQFASFCEEYSLVKSCKSDQVFSNFDLDQDGLLNYPEFKEFVDSITF